MLYNVKCFPMHDWVLVRTVDNPNQRTPGGIWMPETAEQQPIAQVVAWGKGRKEVPSSIPDDLEEGMLVVLQKYVGTKIGLNGKVHMIVKYYDIQAKLVFYNEDGTEFIPELPEEFFQKTMRDTEEEESRVIS